MTFLTTSSAWMGSPENAADTSEDLSTMTGSGGKYEGADIRRRVTALPSLWWAPEAPLLPYSNSRRQGRQETIRRHNGEELEE